MDVKDLITALSNKDVTDAFAASILPTLMASIEEKFVSLSSSVQQLRNDYDSLLVENNILREENEQLRHATESHSARLDALESYTRVDNIIIKGIPETYAEATHLSSESETSANNSDHLLSTVIDLCESLHVQVQLNDISIAHRLPKGRSDQHRPIIVRFSNRRVRDKVYQARRELRNTNRGRSSPVYINEQLSKSNEQLFATCRQLWKNKQIAGTWTWHGVVYAKSLRDTKGIKILHPNDLDKIR